MDKPRALPTHSQERDERRAPRPLHPEAFADLLRRYRIAAGLTQEELAERATFSVRAISDIERGVPHPTLQAHGHAAGGRARPLR